MSKDTLTHQLTETIEELSSAESLKGLFHQHRDGNPLPSGKALEEIISLSRSILFPGYFGNSSVNISTIKYHIGVRVEKLYEMLSEQILAGLCFANDCETDSRLRCWQTSSRVQRLPHHSSEAPLHHSLSVSG